MLRILIPFVVLVASHPSARAGETETEGTVEIVRGGRTVAPKVIEVAPENDAQAKGEEASRPTGDDSSQKSDAEARDRTLRQRQLEELSRQTRAQWQKAANALAGE